MKNQTEKWDPDLYQHKHDFVYGMAEDLVNLLKPEKEEDILDVGCGSGQLTAKISKQAGQVIGLDKSKEMIREASANFPEIEFIVADAATFTLDQQFHGVFSNAALHWMKNYQAVAHNIYGHLKNGGRFVAEFGGSGNIQLILNELKVQLCRQQYYDQAEADPWYFPTIGEYSSVLEQAGFKVRFTQHFDRLTQLVDPERGIIDWIMMFGQSFLEGIPAPKVEEILERVQENLRSELFINGYWHADYCRIRVIAEK